MPGIRSQSKDLITGARLLVALLGAEAVLMCAPLVLALVNGEDRMIRALLWIIVPTLVVSVPATLIPGRIKLEINASEGFLLVFLIWTVFCVFASLPFYVSGYLTNYSSALFEAVSGFTTTGASVFSDVEHLPQSLNLWRAMTHWFGGMGIIVLTVALAPFLGAGAFQLFKAETAGPDKDRWTPKITTQAKISWLVYVGLTFLDAVLLRAGGMPTFKAVFYAFSTLGTGGFTCDNAGILSYHSAYIEWVCIVFMFCGGFNFTLIYKLVRGRIRDVAENSEARAYVAILAVAICLVAISIFPAKLTAADRGMAVTFAAVFHAAGESIRRAAFHVISIMTTTGFLTEDHSQWPALAQCVLFMVMCIGGCSGSTAGGIKVIRFVIAGKQAGNELKKMVYPHGVFLIHIDGKPGQKHVVHGVASFMFAYFLLLFLGALLVASAGYNIWDSANTSLIMLGNIGLGVGKLTYGKLFVTAPDYVRYGLSFLMVTGRLELLTVLVLFTRDYWRKR
jgi:trk system potassium uptake protein TrkH